ncbi:MAG: hypothetical protein HRF46_12040 [Acidobacteriota bacterium]|jgi:predicted phosphodiesterase
MPTITKVGQRFAQVFAGSQHHRMTVDFDQNGRLVVFSDCHRGICDQADDFQRCRGSYYSALKHYADNNFQVILLGDIEELWEIKGRKRAGIFSSYPEIYDLERALNQENRLVRVVGNHDFGWWASPGPLVEVLGPITVHESVLVDVCSNGSRAGQMFLLHGHQGDFWIEDMRTISEPMVRNVWARIQRASDVRSTRWEGDLFELRGARDRSVYYEWAVTQERVVTITGHTHKAVLPESRNLAEERFARRLAAKLSARASSFSSSRDAQSNFSALAKLWRDRITRAELQEGGFRSALLNCGCCCFDTGFVTSLEVVDGEVALATWTGGEAPTWRRARPLAPLFAELCAALPLNFASATAIDDENLGAVG